LDHFLSDRKLVLHPGEGFERFGEVISSPPFYRYKTSSNFKEDDYLDMRIIDFLAHEHHSEDWFDWNGISSGSVDLPYGHTRVNNHAWEQGLKKFFPDERVNLDIQNEKALDEAFDWLDMAIGSWMRNSRVISAEEAMAGVNFSASPGFPLRTKWQKKREAYSDPVFVDYLDHYWDRIGVPNAPVTYFNACLKDEFRPIEKIYLDKTRVFLSGSAEHAHATSRLFKDQRMRLQRACMDSFSCIGIRQTNLDFEDLFAQLKEFKNPGNQDANNWDGSILADLIIRIAKIRFSWLRPSDRTRENWNRILNLYRDVIYSCILTPGGFVYRTNGGIPSGFALTADDNTLLHFAIRCYVAIRKGFTFYEFMDNCKMAIYGDDITYSYNDILAPCMAPEPIIETSKEIGVVFEDVKVNWNDLVFLQHRFIKQRFNGSYYHIAVRDMEPILCGWILGGDGSFQRALERTASYRIQAYFHPVLFNLMTKFMLDTIDKCDPQNRHGFRSLILSDSEIDALYFTRIRESVSAYDPTLRLQSGVAHNDTRHKIDQRETKKNFVMSQQIVIRQPQRVKQPSRRELRTPKVTVIENVQSSSRPKKRKRNKRKRGLNLAMKNLELNYPGEGFMGSKGGVPRWLNNQGTQNQVSNRINSRSIGVSPLTIPQDEETAPILVKYVRCLANPAYQLARVPDSYGQGTALMRSFLTIDLPVTMNASVDNGRFSFLVQPGFGSMSNLSHFKVACVKTDIAWPVNAFDNSANYFSTELGNKDIRIDPYIQILTQPGAFYYSASGTVGSPTANPFGVAVFEGLNNYGIVVPYDGASGFTLQPGQYAVSVNALATTGAVLSGWLATFVNPAGLSTILPEDTIASPLAVSFIVNVVGQSNILRFSETGSATAVKASIIITRSNAEGIDTQSNGGIVQQIRPVGLSVLATYINSQFFDAGTISAAWVPPSSCGAYFFENNEFSDPGQLQNWENLASIPGAYNGKIEEGAYVWWSPRSTDDTAFQQVSDFNVKHYPCLIVSGKFAPTNAVVGSVQDCLRLSIVTVNEFQTLTQLFENQKCPGSQGHIDKAIQIFDSCAHSGPNAAHLAFLMKIGKIAWAVAKDVAPTIWENRVKYASMLF